MPDARADTGHEDVNERNKRPVLRGSTGETAGQRDSFRDTVVVTGRAGLPFLYSLSSALLGGVGRDAEHVVEHLASTQRIREKQ
jgi:hypothetical protein